MEEQIKVYIKTSALLGNNIILGDKLPILKAPKLCDISDNLFMYLSYLDKYIELYEEKKHRIYFEIIKDKSSIGEFVFFVKFFVDCTNLGFTSGDFIFDKSIINYENIVIFMDAIKVLHHNDKKTDNYKVGKLANEMLERSRKIKKEYEAKISKNNDYTLHDIISAVCARHPSINPINVNNLSYYQLIEQYKRLSSIDVYTPCLVGNATEDYIKKNNVKHYVSKIENE